MAATNETRNAFYPYIDGLRAVSIIAVLLFHLDGRLLPGGFAGVDVFFTVSGFVVSSSLHHYRIGSLRGLAAFFYARRFRRIVPALLSALLTTSLFATLFTPYAFLSSYTYNVGVAAFFGYSNIVLARGVDYFSPLGEFNPFTHTWSLAVEEQFYLIFPFLFFFLKRKGHISSRATAVLAAICVASFAYGLVESKLPFDLGFYSSLARFWEIGLGELAYALLANSGFLETVGRRELAWATWIGGALVALAFVFSSKAYFPTPGALAAVAGTLLVIVGLHGRAPTSALSRLLTAPAMLWIGGLSYSLYLWHWPVFVLFRWTVGFQSPTHKALALVVSFACAALSFYLVERPLRRAAFLQKPSRAIPVALAAIVAGSFIARPILSQNSSLALSIVNKQREDWYPNLFAIPRTSEGCAIERKVNALKLGTRVDVARTGCARPASAQTLHVIGDSHALAYTAMFDEFALDTGVKVARYDIPGCSFLQLAPLSAKCQPIVEAAVADLAARVKPHDVVFMPGLRVARFRDQWQEKEQATEPYFLRARTEAAAVWRDAEALIAPFAKTDVRLVFELPKPIFKTPLFRCADWFNRLNPSCVDGVEMDRAFLESYRSPVTAFAERLHARFAGLSIWDSLPYLCGEKACSMWHEGKPLYYDGDHVSAYANKLLYRPFRAEMARQGLREAGASER